MRVVAAIAVAVAVALLATYAQADPQEYGIKEASAAVSTELAGGHPDFTLTFALKTEKEEGLKLPSTTQQVRFDLPPGLLANPNAVPKCSMAQLLSTNVNDPSNELGCPQESQVGITEAVLCKAGCASFREPVFNMRPAYGEPARFGFIGEVYPITIDTQLLPDREYAATATADGLSSLIPILAAETTLWGVPADKVHDPQRITAYEAFNCAGSPCTAPGGVSRPSLLTPTPFTIYPTRCGSPFDIGISAVPYNLPNFLATATAGLPAASGCGPLHFEPSLSLEPTASAAEAPSGLDLGLSFANEGLQAPNLSVDAELKRVEMTLPEGFTVNPSQAAGLDACTEAEFHDETASSPPGAGCPQASKIGTASAKSPLSEETAEGSLYVAEPYANPFDSLLALYLVLKIPNQGVVVKLAGEVKADPRTGQLTSTFDGAPQLPVSRFELHFRGGPRAPLVTPPRCGSFSSTATFTSWAGQVVTTHPGLRVNSGAGGKVCPSGALPFRPRFEAGAESDVAAAHTTFHLGIARDDGNQELSRFSSTLPPGVVASLVGLGRCSNASIDVARSRTGRGGGEEELLHPSCPADSQVGHVVSGAGVGADLTYVRGSLYLAGPYQGAPLSVVAIVPAVTGPFDLGTVVLREPLRLDPRSARVQANGATADPIPQILAGIPLKLREARIELDRPDWVLNPTSCEPSSTNATLWGAGDDLFGLADDSPVSRVAAFQVSDCARLGFKPRLALRLRGGTSRGAFPKLRFEYRPRKADANLQKLVLRLPRSEFIEQGHFRTICTRVQFAAGAGNGTNCPKGSVYGHARVVTPLLEQPLVGPVFLRSSTHSLPDVVLALHGPPSLPLQIEVPTRIDSVDGGLRATAAATPDVPVSRVILNMQGGKKGLIVNSTDLCAGAHVARAQLIGQNDKELKAHPTLRVACKH